MQAKKSMLSKKYAVNNIIMHSTELEISIIHNRTAVGKSSNKFHQSTEIISHLKLSQTG